MAMPVMMTHTATATLDTITAWALFACMPQPQRSHSDRDLEALKCTPVQVRRDSLFWRSACNTGWCCISYVLPGNPGAVR